MTAESTGPSTFPGHRKPAWLDDQPMIVVGCWECWPHLARNNFVRDDQAFSRYERAHTREFIRQIADAGCTLYIGSFWKGLGLEEEKDVMAKAAEVAAYCHEFGMRMGVYIGDTLYHESLREEEPKCDDWAMRDADGDPVIYGRQNWRYRACKNNPDYRAFVKKILHKAVVEAKVDMIHLDNVFTEPYSCYCRHCDDGFQQFVRAKYPPEDWYHRFGYHRPVRLVLPRFPKHGQLKQSVPNTRNPVYTEWLDYRCQAMADAIKDFSEYIRALNPEVAVEVNPMGILGHNNALYHAVDHDRLLKWTDVFWSEEPEPPTVRNGKLITNIRSCKLARATRNHLLLYSGVNPVSKHPSFARGDARIRLAQILAFAHNSAGCATVFDEDDFGLDDNTRRYLRFYREHFDLYRTPKSAARVALWRSSRSLANETKQAHLSAVLWEQMLIQRHVPFDLVLDSHLAELDRYAAVIIPSALTICDEQLTTFTRYVERGGSLIIEATSGSNNHENVQRSAYPADTLWARLHAVPGRFAPRFEPFGEGKVAWVNSPSQQGGVKPSNDLAWYDYLFNAYTNNWEIPANEGELLSALDWAAGTRQLISPVNEFTAFDVAADDQNRLLIHTVNFQPQGPSPLQILLRLAPGQQVAEVQGFSPDVPNDQVQVSWRQDGDVLELRTDALNVYCVQRITFGMPKT